MKRFAACFLALLCLTSLRAPALAAEGDAPAALHLSLWEERVYVDGTIAAFWDGNGEERQALSHNGTVYIPLRTAGEWMGAKVDWDQEALSVTFSSGQAPQLHLTYADIQRPLSAEALAQLQQDRETGVDGMSRPDISVFVDGKLQHFTNVLGEAVYPVLFRECLYLPVRNIGQLCGKQVLWLPIEDDQGRISHIYLYDRPTPAQMADGQQFCALSRQYVDELGAGIDALAKADGLSEALFRERLEALNATVTKIVELPLPSASIFYPSAYGVQGCGKEIILRDIQPFLYPETLLRPEFAAQGWAAQRDAFVGGVENGFGQLDRAVAFARQLCDAVSEAQTIQRQ